MGESSAESGMLPLAPPPTVTHPAPDIVDVRFVVHARIAKLLAVFVVLVLSTSCAAVAVIEIVRVISAAFLAVFQPILGFIVLGLVMLALGLAGWRAAGHIGLRVRQCGETDADLLSTDTLRELLAHYVQKPLLIPLQTMPVWRALAKALAAKGRTGLVVRFSRLGRAWPPLGPPLTEPAEPEPLHRGNHAIPDAPDGALGERDRDSSLPRAWVNSTSRGLWYLSLALIPIFLFVFVWVLILPWIRTGKPDRGLALLGYEAVIFAVIIAIQRRRVAQWFAVPGALIVRSAPWYSSAWTLEDFRREESVIVHDVDHNVLTIASRDGRVHQRGMTPYEITFALRAWRSKLQPPDIEHLSDLA